MNIVILDGYTANPGDLSWDELKTMGEVTVYDRTCPSETVARAAEADIVLTTKVVIGKEEMAQLPRLKYIGVLATGYNVVDIETAHERGIMVTNVPAYSTESVAQMVFAHLLTVTNRTEHYAIANREGRRTNNKDFCYWDFPHMELSLRRLASLDLEISASVWLPSLMLSACGSMPIPASLKINCHPMWRRNRWRRFFQNVMSSVCTVR